MVFDLHEAMENNTRSVEGVLNKFLSKGEGPERRVTEAMRYASLGGGKRIRPFLVNASARLFGVNEISALRASAAIEMVHCYSLIHDDLPAMDDDEIRRGRATCHVQFDEATAILAGDALLTKAFEIIASKETHEDPSVRSDLVLTLAQASGHEGMVGGQMFDLVAEGHDLNIQDITRLQKLKTGELIVAACQMGALLGKASNQDLQVLGGYALDIGLAYQIADDLLDVEGNAEDVGKKTGKDACAGKATFVSLLGVDGAREKARTLSNQANQKLATFGELAEPLRALAHFIVNRQS